MSLELEERRARYGKEGIKKTETFALASQFTVLWAVEAGVENSFLMLGQIVSVSVVFCVSKGLAR